MAFQINIEHENQCSLEMEKVDEKIYFSVIYQTNLNFLRFCEINVKHQY